MSSESDPDEFFDAQDVTPAHERTASMCSNDKILISSEGTVKKVDQPAKPCPLLDLEEEEKRLLEIKKLTEERRRKEEEEIERKLAAIERRKLEELEKQRAEEKAAEYDERRKKLELMRLEVDSNSPSGLPLVKSVKHKSDLTGSVPEIETSRSEPTIQKRSNEAEDVLGLKAHSSSETGEIVPSDNLTLFSESPQKSFMQVNDTINRNRPPNIEVDKVPQKHIPSIEISDCKEASDEVTRGGETPGRGEAPGRGETPGTSSVFILEPDIVQSTKAGSLNRQGQLPPPRPVAPPRTRKQKGKSADISSTNISASSPTKESDVVCGLPVGSDVQGSFHLTGLPGSGDAHPVLDIRSATKGDRVVTAAEDNSSLSAAPDELDSGVDVNKKLFAESSKPSDGLDPSQEFMSLKLGITGCGKNGEGYSIPLSMARPRSNSGSRYLSDKEILDQVFVLNLDTGETVPLSSAEEKLPRCINPLSLHIMRRTKEYSSDSNLYKGNLSDNESTKDVTELRLTKQTKQPGKKKMKIKKFFGKTVHKIKSVRAAHADESSSSDDELSEGRRTIKVKASHTHKGPYDFDLLVPVQELGGGKSNAVWTMKFSHCGRLLATGGQDNLLRVWVLKDAFTYFSDMRQKYNEAAAAASRVSPTPSQDSSTSQADTASVDSSSQPPEEEEECKGTKVQSFERAFECVVEALMGERPYREFKQTLESIFKFSRGTEASEEEEEHMPFHKKPFCVYKGHTADLLDISWSKNYFILSSSMDKTVRLWHISRRECLCCFQHIDFVTAIAFHPKDDRYFLSGSLDGKLRLWNIPDKKVALWNEVSGTTKLITAANFCLNGRFAVVGTYDGRCVFYSTEQLKYFTQINVRSTRGRNARGRKITGVEPFPGEDKILVTSNDSRIRLYDLRDLTLTCKFKGCANNSSQIKASFSHDGKYIICGSEDHFVYIWKTQHDFYKFSSARRDRSDYWEGVKAHTAVVTNAIFAPNPILIIKPQFEFIDIDDKENSSGAQGEVLVSADYSGAIKIFINKFKPS